VQQAVAYRNETQPAVVLTAVKPFRTQVYNCVPEQDTHVFVVLDNTPVEQLVHVSGDPGLQVAQLVLQQYEAGAL